jgi:hypothetical protein
MKQFKSFCPTHACTTPFALIAAGMESLVTGLAHRPSQEEEGHLFGVGINLVFLPF